MSSHPIHRLLPFHILQLIVGVANYFDHPPVLWSHPRWIQFWANVSRISWNVPMSWTARDDPSQKCLCCSCSPNPCSGNCASHALKDVWDAGIKICRFATTCFFSNICPLWKSTWLWHAFGDCDLWPRFWLTLSIGHVVLHWEMLSYQSRSTCDMLIVLHITQIQKECFWIVSNFSISKHLHPNAMGWIIATSHDVIRTGSLRWKIPRHVRKSLVSNS